MLFEFQSPNLRGKEQINRNQVFQVDFKSNTFVEIVKNEKKYKMHFGLISLGDLLRMHKELGIIFLSRNIRAGISIGKKTKTEPAVKMLATLNEITKDGSSIQPEHFTFYHNGVTLVVGEIKCDDKKMRFYSPKILNGAQTVTTLGFFEKENKSKVALLDNVFVMARVLESHSPDDIVRHVTVANNQQNPIHPWNLCANDQIQNEWADFFKDSKGICYSRLENYFENLSDDEREEMGFTAESDIELRPFAQTLAALQGEIQLMSNAPLLFESEKNYKKIFNEKFLKSNPGLMVTLYKVKNCVKGVTDHLVDNSPEYLHPMINRGKNLIWSILLQAIMNDDSLEELVNDYGNDLRIPKEFRNSLYKIARIKVLPLFKDVVNREEYKEKIESEKLDFLRDRRLFSEIMDLARKKNKWEIKKTYEITILST